MYKKVYVICPGGLKTGGSELLHQLVFELNNNSLPTTMVYTGDDVGVPSAFKNYVKNYTYDMNTINDSPDNLLIVSETQIEFLNYYSRIHKAIWWLSVDNYAKNANFFVRWKLYGLGSAIYRKLKGDIKDRRTEIDDANYHFCQSEYAMDYIKKTYHVDEQKIKYLSDYINDCYTEEYHGINKNNRENIVLYNPKKGYSYTKKLIRMSKDLHWEPIENMTNEQVKELLMKSKCYIDFGHHPGKDRFPREAAICGCIIITGKRGAASYDNDVCIPHRFKFDEANCKKGDVINCIKDSLSRYSDVIDEFEDYRQYILSEKKRFSSDVSEIFELGDNQ